MTLCREEICGNEDRRGAAAVKRSSFMLHKGLSASVTAAFLRHQDPAEQGPVSPFIFVCSIKYICICLCLDVVLLGDYIIPGDGTSGEQLCYCEPLIMLCVQFLIALCLRLTCRYQRYPGDAERHGHQRHRGNAEAVLQGAAGASAHRPPLPRLHGGHRCVTF